ncbi:MAG: hypothetical protein ACYC6Y_22585, partial [Thermoguttaceae bacterium]
MMHLGRSRSIAHLLAAIVVPALVVAVASAQQIDRRQLVGRHNVRLTAPDLWSPLSVGNGAFCFTADITGLQTFESDYLDGLPLATMAVWSWHTAPNPSGYSLDDTLVDVPSTGGRLVTYPLDTQSPAAQ